MRNRELFYRLLLTFTPACADTIKSFFDDTNTSAEDYDAIFTGDLGIVGSELLYELLQKEGIYIKSHHHDCGALIFDSKHQNVGAGGSGAGCSASVLSAKILPDMAKGRLNNILYCATGALLSPTTCQQGQDVIGIAHLINIKTTVSN